MKYRAQRSEVIVLYPIAFHCIALVLAALANDLRLLICFIRHRRSPAARFAPRGAHSIPSLVVYSLTDCND